MYFLAVNTEFQSVKDLQTSFDSMKLDVSSFQREIAGVVKSNMTMSNKVDQLKSEQNSLGKRVSKLE